MTNLPFSSLAILAPTDNNLRTLPLKQRGENMEKVGKLGLVVVLLAGYIGYNHLYANRHQLDEGGYSLQSMDEKPIPRAYLFNILHNHAINACSDVPAEFHLSKEQCLKVIDERQTECAKRFWTELPETVASPLLVKAIGDRYIRCVKPALVCNGVEVRSPDEAMAQCEQI